MLGRDFGLKNLELKKKITLLKYRIMQVTKCLHPGLLAFAEGYGNAYSPRSVKRN